MNYNLAYAREHKHSSLMDHKAMMEMYKKMATSGEPHKLFASLEGSWTAKKREWMEPGLPPTESEGTAGMKMLLDRRYLQQ